MSLVRRRSRALSSSSDCSDWTIVVFVLVVAAGGATAKPNGGWLLCSGTNLYRILVGCDGLVFWCLQRDVNCAIRTTKAWSKQYGVIRHTHEAKTVVVSSNVLKGGTNHVSRKTVPIRSTIIKTREHEESRKETMLIPTFFLVKGLFLHKTFLFFPIYFFKRIWGICQNSPKRFISLIKPEKPGSLHLIIFLVSSPKVGSHLQATIHTLHTRDTRRSPYRCCVILLVTDRNAPLGSAECIRPEDSFVFSESSFALAALVHLTFCSAEVLFFLVVQKEKKFCASPMFRPRNSI